MDVYTAGRATTQQLLMKGSVRRDVDAVVDGLIFIGQVTQCCALIACFTWLYSACSCMAC